MPPRSSSPERMETVTKPARNGLCAAVIGYVTEKEDSYIILE